MDAPLDGLLNREQIQTLIGVAEHGSFHRAAERLGVRQPAVSQLIKRLEDRLGRRLFDRTPTGASLTADGEAALIYARAMAALGAGMSRHFARPGPETVIRIGIGEEFGRTALPAVLALFGRLHENFRFQAVCLAPSVALFDVLDAGDLDVVVARRCPTRRDGEIIWTEPTVWVGRPDTALPPADPVPLVLPAAGALRDAVLTALVDAARTWRIVFEGGSLSVLEAAVRAGLGISAHAARTNLGQIVPLGSEAGLPRLPPSVFVLEAAASPRSDAVGAFCEVLRTAARLSFTGEETEGAGGRADVDARAR